MMATPHDAASAKNVSSAYTDSAVGSGDAQKLKSSRCPVPLTSLSGTKGLRYFIHLLQVAGVSDPQGIARTAETTIAHLQNPKTSRGESGDLERLMQDWYTGLHTGVAPYHIYARREYLAELWACWTVYSRRYLLEIKTRKCLPPHGIAGEIKKGSLIVDLGNGIGITTAAFRELYPEATIVGTNILDSMQARICSVLAKEYGFSMHGSVESVGRQADLAFASEYFEHFEDPISHLTEVVNAIRPRRMLIANAFTAKAIGHFDLYKCGSDLVDGKTISREFARAMRGFGYIKQEAGLWNGRPQVWTL